MRSTDKTLCGSYLHILRMYSLNFKVTPSRCDSDGRLKLFSALQMMQDCSEMWIDSEPGVRKYFTQHNMAQLLASRQVEILRVPEYKEELTVSTSVFDMKPMFGFRNTFIYDSDGQPCYRTWSMGAFVDRRNGKLTRVDEATIATMNLEPRQEMNYGDRRIILPKEGGEQHDAIRVMKADIDYNHHMNNANYIRMAMELLPDGVEVKGLRVEYRVAAKLGDMLSPTLFRLADDTIIVALYIGDEVSANIEFTVTKKP